MRHPLKGIWWVESHFHSIKRPDHSGTDYISNDPYSYAIEAGRVHRRFDSVSGWGVNLISLDGRRKWEYIHLFEAGRAPNGATVKEGERIGKWGETKVANVSGPHLHLGLEMPLGTQVDPWRHIEENGGMANATKEQMDYLFALYRKDIKLTKEQYENYGAGISGLFEMAVDVAKSIRNQKNAIIVDLKKQLAAEAKPLAKGKYLVQ